jgi:hypothetical protein
MSDVRMTNKKIWLSFLFIVVGLPGFSYFIYVKWKAAHTIILPPAKCDLKTKTCLSTLPTGEQIEIQIKSTFMPVLTSVRLEAKTHKIPVQKMLVRFKGVDMDMGKFSFVMLPQKNGTYSAQTIIPTCLQEQMLWETIIEIKSSPKDYHASFIVLNERPSHYVHINEFAE